VQSARFGVFRSAGGDLRVTTGFLGALTTFSTFSAEAATLLSRRQVAWAAAYIAIHVIGSIAMTFVGIAFMRFFPR
jgi:CrcB protein